MVVIKKSCGAIVFRKTKKTSHEIRYLLLYKKASGHYHEAWDFPKGNVEKKDGKEEPEQETVKREVKEEAGITQIKFIPKFKQGISFFYKKDNQLVRKFVNFYLVETKQPEVKISYEHDAYKWCDYDKAQELLTFKNSKEMLRKANKFLKEKAKQKTLL